MNESLNMASLGAGPRTLLGCAALLTLTLAAGCSSADDAGQPPESGMVVAEEPGGEEIIEWTVIDDATSGLAEAEKRFIEEASEMEAAALTAGATNLEQIAARAGVEDAEHLRTAAEEMRALARDFPEDVVTHGEVLGRVEGRAFNAIARHHLTVAGRLFGEGEPIEAARHLASAVQDIREGFRTSAVEMPAPTETTLDDAVASSEAWTEGMAPEGQSASSVLQSVREESQRLANALGARRR